ncbi:MULTISPECIES: GvpL/GvpF family gas vesicle protein [Streptomyces]|uniref:GvpL/GvpF family gas vesicle protein n=1 Tax=Streptomyces maoxianensis TaxID=1459942 RepID=A0ABV9G0K5_9ACTN|nr:GvpL/GvpF family gas vesicle protein [Streptomyces sp. ISL-1]MBT2393257.1 GvpL/GvpF family gas vesicle protein [Streptomyces sp. ISL-1]
MNQLRYVYAVTRPFDGALPEDLRGIAGEPPRLLSHGDLVAVVSSVSADDFGEIPLRARLEDLDWLTGTARAHQGVVAALTSITCPLPLRLATVCRDDSGVRRLLDTGRERFVRTLERLDGRVEWGVKVYAETPAPEADTPAESASTGRDYLRRRLSERRSREGTWELADAVSRRLHEELSRRAEAGMLHRPQQAQLSKAPGQNVLNAAYLVPREDSTAFIECVEGLRPDQPGLRVELTGPWAPYSFAGEESDR